MKAQRCKQIEDDEVAYLKKNADEMKAQRRKKEAQIDERQLDYGGQGRHLDLANSGVLIS